MLMLMKHRFNLIMFATSKSLYLSLYLIFGWGDVDTIIFSGEGMFLLGTMYHYGGDGIKTDINKAIDL